MTLGQLFGRGWRRRALCLVLIFGLLMVPEAGYAVSTTASFAVQLAKDTVRPVPVAIEWFKHFFRRSDTPPRQETLADRLAYVTQLQITPRRFVGYLGQTVAFTALPLNANGQTIQGVRFDWESSDTNKALIDDAGRARLLQPGLVRITCHAGNVHAGVFLLVRPGNRPRQSDAEWQADQQSLSETTTTGANGSNTVEQLAASLLNHLIPAAHAQAGWTNDLGYDEQWNDLRNLVGTPRNRAAESTRVGTVMPEGSNFTFDAPIVSLGGRGIGASLTLFYNSRLWSRRSNNMAYNAIVGWPAPGFSLGFGRLVTYDLSAGGNPTCKYMLIDPDGTRHYLGSGSWAGSGYDLGGPFEANDGSHIVYTGNGSHGGNLYYPDGTRLYFTMVNNRLLPTSIIDSNGNYMQVAYKPDCIQIGQGTYCNVFAPMAIDYITDTLGRMIQFNYDSNYRLTSITAPGFGGTAQNPVTQTIVQFDYQTVTANGTFSGLTVERGAGSITTLKHIYFPATGTGYMLSYSIYGVVTSLSGRRQMNTNWQNVIQDGVESNNVSFNYPTPGPITDAPTFTQRTESATNAPTATYTYSSSTNSIAQTKTFTITRPDNSTLNLTRSTNTSSVANGLLTQSEVKTSGGASMAKSVLTYVNDGGGEPQVQTVTSYDDAGTPSHWTNYSYDVLGRTTTVTLPDSQTAQTSYSGNSVTVTDQVNRKLQRLTDGLGRMVSVNEQDSSGALTQVTNYTYDALGNLTEVNQGGQIRKNKYDALSRRTDEKIPEQGDPSQSNQWTSVYTYTPSNDVATRTDIRGVVTSYTYDTLNRLTQVSYNTVSGVTTAPTVTYIYDQDSGTGYSTTAADKLLRVNVGSDYQERYTFDNDYRIASTVRTIGARTYTTSYNSYNEADQLTQMTYPSGQLLYIGHDSMGKVSGLTNYPSGSSGTTYVNNHSHNVAGQVSSLIYGNGVT